MFLLLSCLSLSSANALLSSLLSKNLGKYKRNEDLCVYKQTLNLCIASLAYMGLFSMKNRKFRMLSIDDLSIERRTRVKTRSINFLFLCSVFYGVVLDLSHCLTQCYEDGANDCCWKSLQIDYD